MLLATQPKMSLPNDDTLETDLRAGSNADLVKPAKFQANKLHRHLSLPPLNNLGPFMGNNYLDSPLFLPVITVEPSPTTGIQHLIPPLFQSTASRSTYPESLSTSPRPIDSNPPSGQPSPISKPGKQSAANDDGYQWRKYGEKIVKGSAFPRSYYKCSHQGCPAKKIIEKTETGLANAEYKGQHNHPAPHTRKGFNKPKVPIEQACMPSYNIGVPSPVDLKEEHEQPSDDEEDSDDDNELPDVPLKAAGNDSAAAQLAIAQLRKVKEEEARRRTFSELAGSNPLMQHKAREFPGLVIPTQDPLQALAEAEREYAGQYLQAYTDVEPVPKRFKLGNNENLMDEEPLGKRSVTHTVMDSSQLDDGFKWRKYGQKTVKSNPNPRSYYKCTYPGCTCRKHVERCADDSRKLMITYEGEHNHAPPTAQYMNRSSIRRLSNTGNVVFRPQNTLGGVTADAEEMDASLKLALQALPSVSLPQPIQPAQQAPTAPAAEEPSSWNAAVAPQPAAQPAASQPALQDKAKPALKRNKHLPALKMPEDLANEAQPKDSSTEALPGLTTSSGMPAWPAANASQKGTVLDALAPGLDTPTGGLSWLEGCLTTPKPTSPGKQAVQLPIPPLRDAPPAPLQAP